MLINLRHLKEKKMKFASLTKNQVVLCESIEDVRSLFDILKSEGLIWCTGIQYESKEAETYYREGVMGFCPARGTYCGMAYWKSRWPELEYITFKELTSKPKVERPKKYSVTLTATLESEKFTSMKNVKTFVTGKNSSFLVEFDGKPIIGGHGKNVFGNPKDVKAFKKRGYKTQA